MAAKTKSLLVTRKYLLPIAVLAAFCFNNWLLGPWLNHTLFAHNGSVSEFSAVDQPHYVIFRTLDIFSGLLFMLLAFLLTYYMQRRDKWHHILLWSLAILGFANLMDAVFTLQCSETLDTGCAIPIVVTLHHLRLPSHAYSSVVISISYLTMPLAGLIYSRTRKLRFLEGFSWLAVLAAIATFAAAIAEYAHDRTLSVRTSGLGQEIQMIIIGIWLAVCAYDIGHRKIENDS